MKNPLAVPGFLLLVAAATLTNCKKSNDKKEPSASEKMTLITSSAWKYDTSLADLDNNGIGETAIPPGILKSCDLDNILTLTADGKGTVNEGTAKCDVNDPQTVNITWSFKENETILNLPDTVFNVSGDAKISALTATKLELQKLINVGLPAPVNVVLTLKH